MTRIVSRERQGRTAAFLGLAGVADVWKSEPVNVNESPTVWDRLREYAAAQSGPFASQETHSWDRLVEME